MAKKPQTKVISEPDEEIPFKYSITSYGADYDVDGLVARVHRGDIYVPQWQRAYVWTIKQASRFIESLLLGLPVPGIFLSRDDENQQFLVLDGQQRLRSLHFFFEGVFADSKKEFSLTGIKTKFKGSTYKSLAPEDKRRLGNAIIHATIVRQEKPDDGNSSIYFVFERLNTGGTQLQPQEIRSALYHGRFNELLETLNATPAWRSLFGEVSNRKRDVELILRFFALFYSGANYQKTMKDFLNTFMGKNRDLTNINAEDLTKSFVKTTDLINEHIGPRAFKPKRSINAAIFDSLMVGVARRHLSRQLREPKHLKSAYDRLLQNPEYLRVTEKSTADEDSVKQRLQIATEAFEGIE